MLVSLACSTSAAQPTDSPTSTHKPKATSTITLTPINTPRPTVTPRPTRTPDLAATEQMEKYNTETQGYFDMGYLSTIDGEVTQFDDTTEEWAQLDWYKPSTILTLASDFFMSALISNGPVPIAMLVSQAVALSLLRMKTAITMRFFWIGQKSFSWITSVQPVIRARSEPHVEQELSNSAIRLMNPSKQISLSSSRVLMRMC